MWKREWSELREGGGGRSVCGRGSGVSCERGMGGGVCVEEGVE